MKLAALVTVLYGASSIVASPAPAPDALAYAQHERLESSHGLERRKGGGGGGGKGGSTGGTGSSGSGRTSGSGTTSGSGSTGRGSSSSISGGSTKTGSGPAPAYGNRYTGGATVPYTSGSGVRSPSRNIAPYAIGGAAIGGFGGYWLASSWIYPVYGYYYPGLYHYNSNGMNRTSNVTCLCQSESVCGCDPDDNSTFLAQVLTDNNTDSNGAGTPVNSTNVRTVEFANGTGISYINGSLPNGTTAAGGTEDAFDSAAIKLFTNYAGYGIMVATVVASVMIM